MSDTEGYFLRSRAAERVQESDSFESLTSLEDTMVNTPGQPAPAGEDHVSSIAATLDALRQAIDELRNSTVESQRDLARLRENIQPQADTDRTGESDQAVTTIVPATHSAVKLYDLPTFGGNAEEWPLFVANFNETTTTFRYTNQQNLMRLQKCLVGAAREAVVSMLIHPNDVPNVLSELQFRFGRPDILVKSQLGKLQQLPTIAEHKTEMLIPFSTKVRNVVAFIKSANCDHHLSNVCLLEQMVCKLPPSKQFDWAKHATTLAQHPTIEDFSTWLSELARIVCLMPTNNLRYTTSTNPRRLLNIQNERATESTVCAHCDGDHAILICDAFKCLGVQERWEVVKRRQLCFACLRKGHNTSKCRSKKSCGINNCVRYHNRLLHNDDHQPSASRGVTQRDVDNQPLLNCRPVQSSSKQLFKILPVNIYGPHGKFKVLAMFDEGSAITIIEEETARNIGLKGKRHPLTLQWYNDKVVTEESCKVTFEVSSCCDSKKHYLRDVHTVKNLNLPEQSFVKDNFNHLRDLPLQNYNMAKPVLLIGLNQAHLGISTSTVQADHNSPVAIKTSLGWVAYGPTKISSITGVRILHVRECEQLHQLVSDYFATDNFGVNSISNKLESDAEKQANNILESTTRRTDNRYEVGLLWKSLPLQLPPSREMAEKRLLSVEKRMSRDTEFAIRYKGEMAKYVEKGYAKKLTAEEMSTPYTHIWYLPHFAVSNPNKPSKLRIVFDAAAVVNNVSLNSVLLKGPEQAQPLIRILLQFRQGRIGVAADIREMFSQIKVRPIDQHAQRYLWRDGDSSQPIQEFMMTSMIFGAVCSPCIAEHVKNKNAKRYENTFPEATSIIINNHYVDDLVVSFDDPQVATTICQQIIDINLEAGFELRDFKSNCADVEKALNKKSCIENREIINMERSQTTEKILGMYWNTRDDTFEFHTKFHRVPQAVLSGARAPTKRELLSLVMAIFDPFGLLANFLISSKIMVQDTWKAGIGWDVEIPAELTARWTPWWKEFQRIKEFHVPRYYSPYITHSQNIELHVFVDASQLAFAAVSYFRVVHESSVDVTFIMAKTRTAPKRLMSVPRLELQAAVLGTRLAKTIIAYHDFDISRILFWSDSQTVLQWIHSSERKYKPFVGHRVAEIMNTTNPQQWRWVPTKHNPADSATRPIIPPKFNNDHRWIRGPDFLKYEKDWPTTIVESPTILPEECHTSRILLCQASTNFIKFTNFNSYLKMKRTVGWVLRAVLVFRKKRANVGALTAFEIDEAEKLICKQVQSECFADEIAHLSTSRQIPKQSAIYHLSPFLDEHGILRLNGRIDKATFLPLETRHPILLPSKHVVTEMIVQCYHEKEHHQNTAVIINEVRQKFWIPRIKSVHKRVQHKCLKCIANKAKPAPPLMGQLPIDRITPYVRPFTYAGVDLFGPLNVAVGRRREKRWGVVFTCLTVRAAHIELAEDLSTDAFIVCLRNFINRRGTPVRIRSDNGTNFIGAQKELKSAEQLLDIDRIQTEATRRNIDWVFNCPANPSSGGCWERLIRIIKSLLNTVLRETAPRVATLQSVLIEAENIINSRPLTDLPLTHEDDEPLTPNHFLLGCVNSTQTPHPFDEKICLRKQWLIAQNLKNCIWKRWLTEYLPQLICRTKWNEKATPLRVDDLVLICETSLPRSQWQKGRITKVFPTEDGQVRVAEVKTSGGILRRPATRLARIFIGESQGDSRGEGC